MTIPHAVFLDTQVFERHHFNFDDSALSAFRVAIRKQGVSLLLPDPTARELRRHILQRANDALTTHEGLRKKASFLSSWPAFPGEVERKDAVLQVEALAIRKLDEFLKEANLVRLGYEGLRISEVMDWHEQRLAPFSPKKPKEFPDALAIAALDQYSRDNDAYVAVVSDDPDFKEACARFAGLTVFSNIADLTELLVDDQKHVQHLQAIVESGKPEIEAALKVLVEGIPFKPIYKRYTIGKSRLHSVSLEKVNIAAIGDIDFTVSFLALGEAEHDMYWWEYDTPSGDVDCDETLAETFAITGMTKLRLDDSKTRLDKILMLSIDDTEIEITENPSRYD